MVIPAIAALTAANYEGRERAICYGILGGVAGAGAAVGPLVGGWATTELSWRVVFAAEVVIILGVLAVVPADQGRPPRGRAPPPRLGGRTALGRGAGPDRLRHPAEQPVGMGPAQERADDRRGRADPARVLPGPVPDHGRRGAAGPLRALGGTARAAGGGPAPAPGAPARGSAARRADDARHPAVHHHGHLLRAAPLPAGGAGQGRPRDRDRHPAALGRDVRRRPGRLVALVAHLAPARRAGGHDPALRRRGRSCSPPSTSSSTPGASGSASPWWGWGSGSWPRSSAT